MTHPVQPDYLPRGVHAAPWRGPTGEMVLLVITADATLALPPETVPLHRDVLRVAGDLWDVLDALDPPSRRRTARSRSSATRRAAGAR